MTDPPQMRVVGHGLPTPAIEDPLTVALIGKGYVPHVRYDASGTMIELQWEKPHKGTSGMGWVEAFVLIACLLFLLFVIKGVPW